jgi:hypothetical protein
MTAYSKSINSVERLNSCISVRGRAGAVDTRMNDLSSKIELVSDSSTAAFFFCVVFYYFKCFKEVSETNISLRANALPV